jgi:hypothetical protein
MTYPTTFDVGTPGVGHTHFAEDGSMTLYGADDVTPLAKIVPAGSRAAIKLYSRKTGEILPVTLSVDANGVLSIASADFGVGHGELQLGPEAMELQSVPATFWNQVTAAMGITGTAKIEDGLAVPVSMPSGNAPNGSANFLWPRGGFTAPPICTVVIADGIGSDIGATPRLSGVTKDGGTVLVHYATNPGAATTCTVHVTGNQYL